MSRKRPTASSIVEGASAAFLRLNPHLSVEAGVTAPKAATAEAREAARDDTITRVRQAMQPGEWYTAQQLIEAANLKLSPVGLGRLLNSHIKMTGEFEAKKMKDANGQQFTHYALTTPK
jgi:hypothetical protein